MSRFGLTGSIVLVCGILMGAALVGAGPGGAVDVSGPVTSKVDAEVDAISCAAAGECAAGGYYTQDRHSQPFVVSETNGTWGNPIEVPGMAKLNGRDFARVISISCAAAGECVGGGYYIDRRGQQQAFVVSETNGSWRQAIKVPGVAKLNTAGYAGLDSISCGAIGECAGAGFYYGAGGEHAFVVSETQGSWSKAIEVPGMATLNSGGYAEAYSVSCAAAGDCAAGGFYTGETPDYRAHAFVVRETKGTWGAAIEVPGTAALNTGGDAAVNSISCAAPGACAAGGYYTNGSGAREVFVVNENSGSWGNAHEVPGTATLNTGGDAHVNSISCPAVGECAAAGYYSDSSENRQAFVVSEANGSWGHALEVPGTATLNSANDGGDAELDSISCAAAGDCAAGGFLGGEGHHQVLVVSETNGSWANAIEAPPGTASNHYGYANANAISCAPAGECTAGGFSTGGAPGYYSRAFVMSEANGSWATATRLRSFPALCFVPNVVGWSISDAKKRLNAAYCGVRKITTAYSTATKGRVIAQQPTAGELLKGRASVAVTVSKGTKT